MAFMMPNRCVLRYVEYVWKQVMTVLEISGKVIE